MDYYLLEYVKQRMNEMGFEKFHYEPIRVLANATRTEVKAYNEYYYLLSKSVQPTLVIKSDTNIFNEANAYYAFNYYRIQEFTGLIEISQAVAPIDLQFLRVVPECNC